MTTTLSSPTRTVAGVVLPGAGHLGHRPGPCRRRLHRPPLHGDQGPRPLHRRPRAASPSAEDHARLHASTSPSAWPASSPAAPPATSTCAPRSCSTSSSSPRPPSAASASTGRAPAASSTATSTIHGITRGVPLQVTFEGYARDPWGGDRAVFSAETEVEPRGLRHHLEHGPRSGRRARQQGHQDRRSTSRPSWPHRTPDTSALKQSHDIARAPCSMASRMRA